MNLQAYMEAQQRRMAELLLEEQQAKTAKAKAEAEKAESEARVQALVEEHVKAHAASLELPKVRFGS